MKFGDGMIGKAIRAGVATAALIAGAEEVDAQGTGGGNPVIRRQVPQTPKAPQQRTVERQPVVQAQSAIPVAVPAPVAAPTASPETKTGSQLLHERFESVGLSHLDVEVFPQEIISKAESTIDDINNADRLITAEEERCDKEIAFLDGNPSSAEMVTFYKDSKSTSSTELLIEMNRALISLSRLKQLYLNRVMAGEARINEFPELESALKDKIEPMQDRINTVKEKQNKARSLFIEHTP